MPALLLRSPMPRRKTGGLFAFVLFIMHATAVADNSFWDVLKEEGKAMDIMSINRVDGKLLLTGAKYVEGLWSTPQGSEASPFLPPAIRKQLFVMGIDANEKVTWQQTYPALPDVHEIYSTAASERQRLCVVYGEQNGEDTAVLDPVLLQLDVQGKILWAKRNIITAAKVTAQGTDSMEQIANLDTLRVAASPDNGCVLVYVTRTVSQEDEKFQLHVIEHSSEGDVKWHRALDTQLFGKLFLVHNQHANRYVVVQTNQSRDAAIRAMMLAVPFVPKTSLIGLDYSGAVTFQTIEPPELSKLWVKTALDVEGKFILVAGKTKTAWAGLVDQEGKIQRFTDKFDDEYSASASGSREVLLSRGDHLTVTTSGLELISDQPIQATIMQQYINQYLAVRLPDDLPVQQIIPVGSNEYLLLYTLGSKLLKVRLNKPEE